MTTIPTEPKKRHRLTQADCDTAKYLMEHRQTMQEIGKIIGVDSSTVGKIRLAGYNLETYLAKRRAMNEKTREKKKNRYKALVEETKEEFANAAKGKTAEEIVEEAKKRPRNYQEYLLQLTSNSAGGTTKGVEQVAGQLQMELESQFTPESLKAYKGIGTITEREEKRTEPDGPCARSNTVIPREHTLYEFEKKLDERRFQAAMMDKLLKKLDELIEAITRGRQ